MEFIQYRQFDFTNFENNASFPLQKLKACGLLDSEKQEANFEYNGALYEVSIFIKTNTEPSQQCFTSIVTSLFIRVMNRHTLIIYEFTPYHSYHHDAHMSRKQGKAFLHCIIENGSLSFAPIAKYQGWAHPHFRTHYEPKCPSLFSDLPEFFTVDEEFSQLVETFMRFSPYRPL
ncbi:MAG: hypothetical protein KDK63_02930 [Chlamydiia bacterium]|nr:hypothetical protein [Chlamydiia bacterium]